MLRLHQWICIYMYYFDHHVCFVLCYSKIRISYLNWIECISQLTWCQFVAPKPKFSWEPTILLMFAFAITWNLIDLLNWHCIIDLLKLSLMIVRWRAMVLLVAHTSTSHHTSQPLSSLFSMCVIIQLTLCLFYRWVALKIQFWLAKMFGAWMFLSRSISNNTLTVIFH